MNVKFPAFLAIFLMSLPVLNAVEADSLSFSVQNYSKEDYLAQNQNWSVDMDQNGIMYFANNGGLLEFDGISWTFYPSPGGTIMRAVTTSPDGRIYTSGYRELGYWTRDDFETLHYHSLNPLATNYFTQNEEFWNIKVLKDRIVFHSFSTLYVFNDSTIEVIDPDGFINTVALINDSLYVHIRDQGLYVLNESNILVPFRTGEFFEGKLIRTILPYDNGKLLIGTASDGLFLMLEEDIVPVFPELYPFLSSNQINRGYVVDDIFIIGTILNGIIGIRRDGRIIFQVNRENGLQNNTVLGIKTDRYDNIWITLDRGIDFISFHVDPSFEIHNNLDVGAVYTASIFNDKLYLGTNQGLFYKGLENNTAGFRLVPKTQGQVWDSKVYDDHLFVGHNNGTFVIKEGTTQKISDVSGGFSMIRNTSDPDELIQSSYSNLVTYKKINGTWQQINVLANFMELIRYLEQDHLNNLWASHMHRAIYKLQLNDTYDSIMDVRYYDRNSVFTKDFNIHVFKVENRIVFTTGDSLFTYDDMRDTIIPYDILNASLGPFKKAHRIISAPDHHYWFISAHASALFQIRNTNIDLVKQYPFNLFQNQVVEGFENILPIDSRRAYLCLENGYALLDTRADDDKETIKSMKLSLRTILVSGKEGLTERISFEKERLILNFNKANLELRYAFPKYSNAHIQYQYFIEGLDNQWSEPMEKPIFKLSRLPVGDFVILAKATNDWSESSDTHELQVQVRPPWYWSPVAIVFYLILLVGLFILIQNISMARLRRIERKRREVKEQQLTKLRNEKLRSELAYKSRELANSTMSIIQKNEFLLELKENLKHQKSVLGDRFPYKYYQSLVKKIDKNLSGGDDWKIFEAHLEKAYEPFIQHLLKKYPQLSYSDLRLCTYLRMNLSSKEIAPLLHISVRGVENHRYRLRRKLNVSPKENLTDFILGLKV